MTRTVVGIVAAGVLASAIGVLGQGPAGPPPTAPNPATCEGQPGAAPAAAGEGRGRGAGRGAAPAAPASTAPRAVTVTAIPGVIAAGAKFTQVWQTTGNNADGIVAMPTDGSLLVNQEDNSAVLRIDKDDKVSVFLSDTHGSGSLSFNRMGQLLAVQRLAQPNTPAFGNPSAPRVSGISMLWPERKMVADTFADGTKLMGRPNDLTADRTGGAYFSQGCVYYASAAGKVTLVAENIRTNGIVLSADEKTLYVTNGPMLAVFDAPEPGKLTNRREWMLEGAGAGDGITVDAAGRVYVASGIGVQVFSPEGKHLGVIPTPSGLTGEVFAGPDKKTLYVVAAGSVDADGKPSTNGGTGRTIYRIPMIAEGLKGRSK
jgi:gluconolactonase